MTTSYGQSERGVEAARCEAPAAFAASVLLTTCKSAAVQCSKPAGSGACDCATRNGIAIRHTNQIFFISNHLNEPCETSSARRHVNTARYSRVTKNHSASKWVSTWGVPFRVSLRDSFTASCATHETYAPVGKVAIV